MSDEPAPDAPAELRLRLDELLIPFLCFTARRAPC